MQSRLREQLLAIEARKDDKRRAEAVQAMVYESGDALEMAARAAEGAWDARPPEQMGKGAVNCITAPPELFEYGYRLACAELAYVLRRMRKGEQANSMDLRSIARQVYAEVYEDSDDGIAKDTDEQIEMGFD